MAISPPVRRPTAPTIALWAQVTPELWVATLGAVHLGRVEQQGTIFHAINHVNAPLGAFTDNLRARRAVTDNTDAAVAFAESGEALPALERRHYGRVAAAIVVGCLVLAAAATALVGALLR